VAANFTSAGVFIFTGLAPGDYYMQFDPIDAISISSWPTEFPNDDGVDGNDNGVQPGDSNGDGIPDGTVISNVFTLSPGTEPIDGTEIGPDSALDSLNDSNGDMTIDFGLFFFVEEQFKDDTSTSNRSTESSDSQVLTAIEETKTKVYPNPVRDNLILEIDSHVEGSFKGALFSSIGEKVYEMEEGELTNGFNLRNIDVSGFDPGTYLLKLEIGNEVIFNKVTVIR